eukprot:13459110-Heterocapsa_arctica.AAC.1
MIKASCPITEGMEYSHLRCLRIRLAGGTLIKMPTKYVEKMQKELEMENCSSVPTPIIVDGSIDETEALDAHSAHTYRTVNGIM